VGAPEWTGGAQPGAASVDLRQAGAWLMATSTVRQAYRFALDPTPTQARALASHCGAARYAYNWGLALVKQRLDLSATDPEVEVPWTLARLRREWNRAKDEVAPWWAKNSKEAYSSGLDGLARALKNWAESRNGKRLGRRVGFRGSSASTPRGSRAGSRPGCSASSRTAITSPCRGLGKSGLTSRPASSPAVWRRVPPESCPPRSVARHSAGMFHSPARSSGQSYPAPPARRSG
jgi:hypothetical protein